MKPNPFGVFPREGYYCRCVLRIMIRSPTTMLGSHAATHDEPSSRKEGEVQGGLRHPAGSYER
jgi:hypothetical protein